MRMTAEKKNFTKICQPCIEREEFIRYFVNAAEFSHLNKLFEYERRFFRVCWVTFNCIALDLRNKSTL